ncbi:MAG: DUF2807 domain-containing protein [Bacteroidetes bacterium]|nr:DUF2807 domain-containing protein [Bacteroidota bacterium]
MKKITATFFLAGLLTLLASGLFAQTTGNGKVIAETHDLPYFNAVDAGGAINLILVQADKNKIIIETDENLMPLVNFKVSNGTLRLTTSGIRKATRLDMTVFFNEMKLIELSGAVKAKTEGDLTSEHLTIKCSGATSAELSVSVVKLVSSLSGASKITLLGSADEHNIEMSGASRLIAGGLRTSSTTVNASGASDALIDARDFLKINTSGVAKVRYDKEPARIEQKAQSVAVPVPPTAPSRPSTDTVSVTVGNVKVRVIDGDSTVVELGDRKLVVNEKGNVSLKRTKRNKFNGHWSGLELGLNGYLIPDFSLNMPSSYLDLQMEKSIAVNLNFYEQNIPLNKSRTFGIVSGLGLTWNNYRFDNNVMLRNENREVKGYFIEGVGMNKSKLVNTYLTVPVYFELQTNTSRRKEKAHLALGVVGGWRFSSHTKLFFLEANKPYNLIDENGQPVQGTWVSPGATRRNIVKDYNSFQQNPFKLDASIRAGWGFVNLFANYSLTPMFIKDRGPELYPFAVGLTLTSF